MKKIFLFAATAAMLAACSSDQLEGVESAQQKAADNAINFSAYTPRVVTRAGHDGIKSAAGDQTVTEVKTNGFGILGYYTDDSKYDSENSKPNFMYNTKVTNNGSSWVYNPVMYWPNEFGATATSDYFDYVSFFAYAPYVDVENTTGIPVVTPIADYDTFVAGLGIKYFKANPGNPFTVTDRATFEQGFNGGTAYATDAEFIAAVEAKLGQPSGTYATAGAAESAAAAAGLTYNLYTNETVDDVSEYTTYIGATDAAAARAALDNINKEQYQGKNITAISKNSAQGDPIVKYAVDINPKTSVDLLWGVADNNSTSPYYTPIAGPQPVVEGKPFIDLVKPNDPATDELKFVLRHALAKLNVDIKYIADQPTTGTTSDVINTNETRIYVRWIKIGGFVMKGALNLNNTQANKANWKAFDGTTALTTGAVTFFDGRKDGKEGTEGGAANGETPNGLNPLITENYVPLSWPWGTATWAVEKSVGVTETAVNLFGVGAAATDPIFVIPTGEDIDIEICYDVETADENVATFLSDGVTRGTSIENKISKKAAQIFKTPYTGKMNDNMAYTIHIILGMTSVKFDASVEPWGTTVDTDVELPYNTHP